MPAGKARSNLLAGEIEHRKAGRSDRVHEEWTAVPGLLTNARRDIGRSGLVDDLVVPALLIAGQGWESAQPALRSPRARAVVALPLVAIALRVGSPADGQESSVARRHTWPYARVIRQEAAHNRLAPALVASVISEESAFNPRAHNATSGAEGLMQLAPGTSRALGVNDPMNPRQSVRGGCRYLRELLDRFHDRLSLALAAYNAGPTIVERTGTVPGFAETRRYVSEVLRRYTRYRGMPS
jgi:soluble lytic murein transglycosylase-like protein